MTDIACSRCGEHSRPRRSTAQYCSPTCRKASARSRAVSVPLREGLRRRCVPARLQDGARGDCLEAARLALPLRPIAGLAQVQEPGRACGEARGGRGLGKMRGRQRLSELGAFSRNRAVKSFNALDRSNTGSAKNTPKSDMDLLACIQHLASLNWASHRMAARSPTSCVPKPGARSRILVGISLSYGLLLWCVAAVKEMVQTLVARWS